MIKLLPRHTIKDFILYMLGALIFLGIIGFLAEFLGYLEEYISRPGQLASGVIYHLLRIPYIMYYVFPLSIMFSATFVLGTMVKNNEMICVYNAGISLFSYIKELLLIVLILGIGVVLFWEYIAAPAAQKAEEIKKERRRVKTSRRYNNEISIYGMDGNVFFIDKYDIEEQTMFDVVFINIDEENRVKSRLRAENASYDEEVGWSFYDGSMVLFDEAGSETSLSTFSQTNIPIREKPHHFERESVSLEFMSISQNYKYLLKMRDIHGNEAEAETEFHYKFAVAFISLILVILSAAFARFSSQSVLVISLALVLLCAILFYVVMFVGKSLASSGVIPPIMGAWLNNIVFFVIAVTIFRYYSKR